MNARIFGVGLLAASFALTACGPGDVDYESAALDTDDQKASYGIGINMGDQLAAAGERIDMAALMRGVHDALEGNESAVPEEEMQQILMAFGQDIEAAMAAEQDRVAEENAIEGEAYLAENARRDGVTTTDTGLQYEVLREGDGAVPTRDQTVRIHYRGTLADGTEFDSSYGGEPAQFPVSGVIPGFTEALLMMPVGSHYRIVIPSDLGYGPRGSGPIPPNSTLVFEIELLEIVDAE